MEDKSLKGLKFSSQPNTRYRFEDLEARNNIQQLSSIISGGGISEDMLSAYAKKSYVDGKFNELPALQLLKEYTISTTVATTEVTITPSANYNVYNINPLNNLTINFNGYSLIANDDGYEFYINVNLTNGIKNIVFSDNFKFKQNITFNKSAIFKIRAVYDRLNNIVYCQSLGTSNEILSGINCYANADQDHFTFSGIADYEWAPSDYNNKYYLMDDTVTGTNRIWKHINKNYYIKYSTDNYWILGSNTIRESSSNAIRDYDWNLIMSVQQNLQTPPSAWQNNAVLTHYNAVSGGIIPEYSGVGYIETLNIDSMSTKPDLVVVGRNGTIGTINGGVNVLIDGGKVGTITDGSDTWSSSKSIFKITINNGIVNSITWCGTTIISKNGILSGNYNYSFSTILNGGIISSYIFTYNNYDSNFIMYNGYCEGYCLMDCTWAYIYGGCCNDVGGCAAVGGNHFENCIINKYSPNDQSLTLGNNVEMILYNNENGPINSSWSTNQWNYNGGSLLEVPSGCYIHQLISNSIEFDDDTNKYNYDQLTLHVHAGGKIGLHQMFKPENIPSACTFQLIVDDGGQIVWLQD